MATKGYGHEVSWKHNNSTVQKTKVSKKKQKFPHVNANLFPINIRSLLKLSKIVPYNLIIGELSSRNLFSQIG